MKQKLMTLLLCAVCALAFAACGDGDAVATVNGEKISTEVYQEYVGYMVSMYGLADSGDLSADMSKMVQTQAIDSLVYMEELKQACAKEKCTPTEKEINDYVYENLGVEDDAAYKEALAGVKSQYGLGEETLRAIVAMQLYSDKLGDALAEQEGLKVTDEEIRAKYDEAPEEYDTRTVSHILVSPEAADGREVEKDENGEDIYTDEEWAAAEAEAKDIIAELDGGADFATLAKEKSDDTGSAEEGGAVGEAFTVSGSSFVEEFTTASFELHEKDEYTKEPVKSQFGYHIILCTGIQDADHDLEGLLKTVKEDQLKEEKQTLVTDYMDKFEEESDIVIYYGSNATDEEEETDAAADDAAADDAAADDAAADDAAADDAAAEEAPAEDAAAE